MESAKVRRKYKFPILKELKINRLKTKLDSGSFFQKLNADHRARSW
jgi:hypothetical protein